MTETYLDVCYKTPNEKKNRKIMALIEANGGTVTSNQLSTDGLYEIIGRFPDSSKAENTFDALTTRGGVRCVMREDDATDGEPQINAATQAFIDILLRDRNSMRKIVGACRRHAVSQAARNPDITVKMLTALRLVERLTRMIPDFSPTPQDVDAVVAMLVIGPTFLS